MGQPVPLVADRIATPVGPILIVAGADGRLCAAQWEDRRPRLEAQLARRFGGGYVLARRRDPGGLSDALRAYLRGDLRAIDGLPVDPGGTPFQRAVWEALRAIPCGRTMTYAALAARLGRPSAGRAVGHANGANPVSIVIPCHRLVGAGGALTGYGGGLERKRWLLEHEGVGELPPTVPPVPDSPSPRRRAPAPSRASRPDRGA